MMTTDHGAGAVEGPVRFDLASVERALSLLWQEKKVAGQRQDALRACSINLILLSEAGAADGMEARVSELSRLVPSRILVMRTRSEPAQPAVEAYVSATCPRRKGGVLVCSEVIHLTASADAMMLLASIARALAVSDLPVCLVAPDLPAGEWARPLLDAAEIIIADSALSGSRLEALGAERMTDLAWPRLVPWRSALGRFLGSCTQWDPDSLAAVHIAGQPGSAFLFAGWLGLLLGWQVDRRSDRPEVRTSRAGNAVRLRVDPPADRHPDLSSVELRFDLDPPGRIQLRPLADGVLEIDATLGGKRLRALTHLQTPSFAEQVARLIHSHEVDRLYQDARALARRINPGGL